MGWHIWSIYFLCDISIHQRVHAVDSPRETEYIQKARSVKGRSREHLYTNYILWRRRACNKKVTAIWLCDEIRERMRLLLYLENNPFVMSSLVINLKNLDWHLPQTKSFKLYICTRVRIRFFGGKGQLFSSNKQLYLSFIRETCIL